MKINIEKPLSRQKNIVIQELSREVLIYDFTVHKAFCLNESSALIWSLCDGTRSIWEISQAVSKKLSRTVTENFVSLALDQFKKENLLVNGNRIKTIDEFSRRKLIRKIGLASVITLPLLTSVVAPTAAMAASPSTTCGDIGTRCTTGSQCCSTYCDDCFTGTCQPDPGGLGGCL